MFIYIYVDCKSFHFLTIISTSVHRFIDSPPSKKKQVIYIYDIVKIYTIVYTYSLRQVITIQIQTTLTVRSVVFCSEKYNEFSYLYKTNSVNNYPHILSLYIYIYREREIEGVKTTKRVDELVTKLKVLQCTCRQNKKNHTIHSLIYFIIQ